MRGPLPDALAHVHEQCLDQNVLPQDITLSRLRALFEGYAEGVCRNGRLANAYRPMRLPDRIALVKPEGSLFPDSRTLGWHALAGAGLNVVSCPGDHYSLLTQPAAVARLSAIFHVAVGDAEVHASQAWDGRVSRDSAPGSHMSFPEEIL